MEKLIYENKEYEIIKSITSDDKIYYYTIDHANDNEVVFFSKIEGNLEKIEEREYSILMNMFSIN